MNLHCRPEPTWQETATAQRIRDEMTALGLTWRSCAGTGTIVDLGPTTGQRIAVRADIDALPINEATGVPWQSQHHGCMHACGHDGHTACLFGLAKWLAPRADALPHGVRLLFQPAEEGGHGAREMIADGCLENVSEIYGYHNLPTMPIGRIAVPDGPVMVANGAFDIAIDGLGGHASMPESCRDPIVAAAAFIQSVQQIVSRKSHHRTLRW